MMSFVQGALAAATTACLYRQITTAKEKQKTWENVALGANHLLLIAGAALREIPIQLPGFSLSAKTIFLLTPLVLIASFSDKRRITAFEKSTATRFSQFYYLTTSVSSVAMIALGNKDFGIAALSVLAFDWAVHQKQCPRGIRVVFTLFLHTAAVATFVGYAARLSTVLGQALITVIGITLFLPKIAKLLPEDDSDGESPRKGKARYPDDKKYFREGRYYQNGRDCFHCPPACPTQGVVPSSRSTRDEGGPSLRGQVASIIPSLPHNF
jgi:hypothetical protein